MGTRQQLAFVAKAEAQRFYHGRVLKAGHNLHEIIQHFPDGHIDEFDGMWCAAFVYHCCVKAGYKIPYHPSTCSCSLAGCKAWEELAKADEDIIYATTKDKLFTPAAGDIVLFDRVFMDTEHDHIGIVLKNCTSSIVIAEGNFNNVSAVVERAKNEHVRAYIRLTEARR